MECFWNKAVGQETTYCRHWHDLRPLVMAKRAISVILLATAIAGYAGWVLRGHSDIDACLDAGGRWEERGGYCVGAVFGATN